MPDNPQVSIIIPTLLAGDSLNQSLSSIASDTGSLSHEVIVVFNCPIPAELDLRPYHTKARAVQAPTNLGFAAGCNLGVLNSSAEFLVFLNDDMIVQPGWLDNLIVTIINKEVDAVGGQILNAEGKKIDFAGGSISLTGWGFQKGHGEDLKHDEFDIPTRIPFACGGNMAVKNEVFDKVGGFDEDYFAFVEDVDLGWRLRLAGYNIGYCPEAITHHKAGTTGSLIPPALKWFLQERNALQTIIKNYSDEMLWKILPIALSLVAVRANVISDLDPSDFAQDRVWREWVLNQEDQTDEQRAVWDWLVDNVREKVKSGMKSSRKASVPPMYSPMNNNGVAGLYAVEWCMKNWDRLMEKRRNVQAMRTREDGELVSMFDDAVRPVLGHPREVAAMLPLERLLESLVRE
ncbi:MAG TPA: glycosyltransferase family 2 protein [bacterium]|jgi:GT2 family glycosyltransferase